MKPRREFKYEAAALLMFMLVCAAAFTYMWKMARGDTNPFDTPYRVQAVVPTAVSLGAHADVRRAGVTIGEVSKTAPRGDNAVLLLQLKREHAPVYRDARVLVRTKTLSGENYVELDPGSPRAGRVSNGGVLSIDHAGQAVQLDEIFSTFDRRHRRDLQRLLDGLGEGLHGHGDDLNRFLEGQAAVIQANESMYGTLAADRRQVATLIDDFGRVARAFGDRANAIRLMTRRSKQLAEAVAARDVRLRETLAELPGFLRQTRRTTGRLGAFAGRATPVVRDLRAGMDQLAPSMQLLRPATARARDMMGALTRFTRVANPMAEHLRPFSEASSRLTPPLEDVLRQVNPLQAHLAPYWRDLGGVVAQLRGAVEHYDATGHYSRTLVVQSRSNAFGGMTPEQEAAYKALIKAGGLTLTDTRGQNPYPEPGRADDLQPFQGDYTRLQPDPPYDQAQRR